MGMKRKRNELDDSPVSSTSTSSSANPSSPSPTPRHSQTIDMIDAPRMPQFASTSRAAAPTDPFYEPSRPMLSSRTRKRWRDNRPDIDTIHANTLQKLFDAQRQDANALSGLEVPQAMAVQDSHPWPQPRPQTSSLHSFWSLPGPPPQPSLDLPVSNGTSGGMREGATSGYLGGNRCEDCDAVVTAEDAMEWDGIGRNSSSHGACQSCGKRVCDACAVVKNARLCIPCA